MKLTQIKPGELYKRDWDNSTDVVDVTSLKDRKLNQELYMMLWQDTEIHRSWMGIWVLDRAQLVEFNEEQAAGAEFVLVT